MVRTALEAYLNLKKQEALVDFVNELEQNPAEALKLYNFYVMHEMTNSKCYQRLKEMADWVKFEEMESQVPARTIENATTTLIESINARVPPRFVIATILYANEKVDLDRLLGILNSASKSSLQEVVQQITNWIPNEIRLTHSSRVFADFVEFVREPLQQAQRVLDWQKSAVPITSQKEPPPGTEATEREGEREESSTSEGKKVAELYQNRSPFYQGAKALPQHNRKFKLPGDE